MKSLVAALALALLVCGGVSCGGDKNPSPSPAASAPSQDWFVERAKESGLDFVHFNGMSGEQYYPEIMAPGVGLLDYDNDGDLDVYVTQGAMLGANKTFKD